MSTCAVFAGGFDGTGCIIYEIKPTGELHWYRDEGPCVGGSAMSWASGRGTVIGQGWADKLHMLFDLTGSIYATIPDGTLQYYKHTSRGPSSVWENEGVTTGIGTGSRDDVC